jgi:hypothetical protein
MWKTRTCEELTSWNKKRKQKSVAAQTEILTNHDKKSGARDGAESKNQEACLALLLIGFHCTGSSRYLKTKPAPKPSGERKRSEEGN